MSLFTCQNCQKPFDVSLNQNHNLLCPFCGHLNSNTDADTAATTPTPSNPPEPPQTPSLPVPLASTSPNPPARKPCDWEINWLKNPVAAYVNTTKTIYTDPVYSFDRLLPFENLLSLFAYMYINFFIVMLGAFCMAALVKLGEGTLELFQLAPEMAFAAPFFSLGFVAFFIVGFFMLFFVPIIQVLITTLVSLFIHLFLQSVGGAQKDHATTLTVFGLSTALNWLALIMFIPFVGPFLHAMIRLAYFVLVGVVGMGRIHEITLGKVVLSYLVPFLICCCCLGALGVAVPAFLAFVPK